MCAVIYSIYVVGDRKNRRWVKRRNWAVEELQNDRSYLSYPNHEARKASVESLFRNKRIGRNQEYMDRLALSVEETILTDMCHEAYLKAGVEVDDYPKVSCKRDSSINSQVEAAMLKIEEIRQLTNGSIEARDAAEAKIKSFWNGLSKEERKALQSA